MSSFYAELHLAGFAFPVLRCSYSFQQATSERGRASAKVRHGPLHLLLDVPEQDLLLAWAAAPFKPLAGQVAFYSDAQARLPHESISFAAGQCVRYAETFDDGTGGGGAGAYVCALTITAPAFALHVGGGPATAAAPAVVAAALTRLSPAAGPTPGLVSTPGTGAVLSVPLEYTLDEFKATIWGADQVAPAVIAQLYDHFVAAKVALQAKADPALHWAAMSTLVHSTTYPNPKTGLPEVLNGGWPPASGGFNKRLVQPTPPDKFDRYQKTVKVDADGLPILEGKFTSPLPKSGAFDYEARALEGQEKEYDLVYEIELIKPLPFTGEEAEIIPWHGHTGNGVQTQMLFPPKDPVTGTLSSSS